MASIREGKNAEFREKYRQADAAAGGRRSLSPAREQTQEEFFHTFNSLGMSPESRIVLTSDRPPGR